MTLAIHWEPASGAGSSPDVKLCPSGKLGFDSASELLWWMKRRRWLKAATHLYRCPSCGQFHATSQSPTEHKRVTKRTRRRHGLTGTPRLSEPEAAQ
jgi:hypothetical protein